MRRDPRHPHRRRLWTFSRASHPTLWPGNSDQKRPAPAADGPPIAHSNIRGPRRCHRAFPRSLIGSMDTLPIERRWDRKPSPPPRRAGFLRNQLYIGEVVFKGQICPESIRTILDRDLFEAVQRKLSEQWLSQRPWTRNSTYRPVHISGTAIDERDSSDVGGADEQYILWRRPVERCRSHQMYTPTHRRLGRNSLCFSVWGILLGT
jgi:hypothetical protein